MPDRPRWVPDASSIIYLLKMQYCVWDFFFVKELVVSQRNKIATESNAKFNKAILPLKIDIRLSLWKKFLFPANDHDWTHGRAPLTLCTWLEERIGSTRIHNMGGEWPFMRAKIAKKTYYIFREAYHNIWTSYTKMQFDNKLGYQHQLSNKYNLKPYQIAGYILKIDNEHIDEAPQSANETPDT